MSAPLFRDVVVAYYLRHRSGATLTQLTEFSGASRTSLWKAQHSCPLSQVDFECRGNTPVYRPTLAYLAELLELLAARCDATHVTPARS